MNTRNILFALVCFMVSSLSFADRIIFQPGSAVGKDMWISSMYNQTAVDDNKLQVGGWGDSYRLFIQFDLAGLPQSATSVIMGMYAYPRGDSSTPVATPLYLLTSAWSETTQNFNTTLYGYYAGTLPPPTLYSWYNINITGIYNGWKNGTYANNGFVFLPESANNQFNVFRSSDYTDPTYRPRLIITYNGANLSFPLDCSTPGCSGSGNITYSSGAYTAQGINSVVDHNMTAVYSNDGVIVSFTGETFNTTSSYPSSVPAPCYPKAGGATWSTVLAGLYKGTSGSGYNNCTTGAALNYDAHPGYDYRAATGTPVYAAASGTVVNFNSTGQRCIPKGISAGCGAWGAIGIDHGNGYITQYLHMGTISVNSGDSVAKDQFIGYSGTTAPGGTPAHLHFEVLNRTAGSSGTSVNDYKVVDPYGWTGGGTDPLENITGIKSACLWENCQ